MFELASMIARQTRLRREIRAPHYTTRHLAGALPEFRADALGLFERIASLGDVVHFRLAWMNAFHVREPDAIKRILVDNARNYGKQTVGYDKMRVFMGNGLVTSEGDFWRRQRRIAQPAFHKQRLAEFAATMTRMAEDLAEEWEVKAKAGEVIDLSDEMMKITLRIVASTVLSLDVGRDEKSVGADVRVAGDPDPREAPDTPRPEVSGRDDSAGFHGLRPDPRAPAQRWGPRRRRVDVHEHRRRRHGRAHDGRAAP
jgi:cytochrome P450